MTKHRSRTDITAEILKSANGRQVTKINLMYGAFLSYVQLLKSYLTVLIENGLLEYQNDSSTYRTTGKGVKFLEVYGKMSEIVPGAGLPEVKL